MKNIKLNIKLVVFAMMICIGSVLPLLAQTPAGTQITNTATGYFNYQDGQKDSVISSVSSTVQQAGYLALSKTASPSNVVIGDVVLYRLIVRNTGNGTLTNGQVIDSLPSTVSALSWNRGSLNNGVFTWNITSLPVGAVDTAEIVARVNSDVKNNTYITNYAFGFDGDGNKVVDSARIVAQTKIDYSCQIGLSVDPKLVIGNGISAAIISAFLSDTLGNPKPDGTPVYLKSSLNTSFFSNGKDSIVAYTKDGWVYDSLRALITGGGIFTAKVIVSARDSNICSQFDTLEVVFYPGAITGMVYNDDTEEAVEGARVIISSAKSGIVGNIVTKSDGRYLIPVPSSDVYTIRISAKDTLGQMISVSTSVAVNVPGVGGLPPVYQPNISTGTIYYYINRKPIPIAGLKLYLFKQNNSNARKSEKVSSINRTTATLVDSTFTNEQGTYQFDAPQKGTYEILPADPTINTSRTMHVPESTGVYIINSNSPVIPNPNITLTKTGATNTFIFDTVTYTINAQNNGTLPLTNAQLVDSLSHATNYISSSNSGIYDAVGHRVLWSIGKFDSLSSRSFTVTVSMRDSNLASYTALNRVSVTSDEMYPEFAQAQTQVAKSNPAVSISKVASKDSVVENEIFQYIIRIQNIGNKQLTNVALIDTINIAYLNPISVDKGSLSGNIIQWTKDTLDVDAVDTIKVLVQLKQNAVVGDSILNIVYGQANEFSQTVYTAQAKVYVKSNASSTTPNPILFLAKIASADTINVGDTVTYKIQIRNIGNIALTNITVTDTLQSSLIPVSVINAQLNGSIVTYSKDSLVVGESDSILIKARISINQPNNKIIVNRVWGKTSVTSLQDTTAIIVTRVNVTNKSCRIHLTAIPSILLGDGIQASVIKAFVTDTLGNPKPDGTPILFKSPIGKFSNGVDSIIVPAVNGWAIDSLTADVTGIGIVETYAKVSASDADICSAIDSIKVIFYPGAIEGVVIDNKPPYNPVEGAKVEVFGTSSNNPFYDSRITLADGYYFVPVPKSDIYIVRITIIDDFNEPVVTETNVRVTVPEKVVNENSISGKVYYYVSNKPIVARYVAVQLDSVGAVGSLPKNSSGSNTRVTVATTRTDSSGTYIFKNVRPGKYQIATSDPYLKGEVNVADMVKGRYIINANIPIILNPNIKFVKVGPSVAFAQDTVTYSILVRNDGNVSIDSTVVTDSLDASMIYVSAGARSGASHTHFPGRVTWNVGHIDSLGGSDSLWIKVRFSDTLTAQSSMLTNSVFMTSDKTTRMDTSVTTTVVKPELLITKQAMLKIVNIGDVATYKIKVTNNSPSMSLSNIRVSDYIPFGFKYVAGSTFIGNQKIADPQLGKEIVWSIKDSLKAGASVEFVYRLVAGAGAAEGNGINSARAYGQTPSGLWIRSILVSERIEVRKGIFTDHGVIIGKVFYDKNRNAYQDEDEEGVKDVELMMEDGARIVTGDDGKYSLPDVLPGQHVIKVRKHTLPKNAELILGYNDFAGDPTSRFVNLTPAGIARVDFYLNKLLPDTLDISQSIAKVGDVVIQRIAQPRNIVFIEDEKYAPMKLSGLNFDVGKATLRPEAFPTLKQLADILFEYPDITATIVGHTDSSPIKTKEFPNNTILSNARAMSVKKYLASKEGIDTSRIRTIGYGEFKPIATNKTKEGKALNRRVEFYFGDQIEQPRRTASTILYQIPIHYDGSVNISKIEFTDVLDERLQFVQGSSFLNDSVAVTPRIEGNKLHWTIENIGTSFHKTLLYRAVINQPSEKHIVLNTVTTAFKYYMQDSTFTSDAPLLTTNEVAIALRGRAVNYILSGVLFDVAKATLRSTAVSALSGVVEALKNDPTATALIEGHTDSSPINTKEFPNNTVLSNARAKTVAMKLVSDFGISPSRLRWVGFGEYRPIATNKTADGRQQNRRVEMRIFTKSFIESVIQEGFTDTSDTESQKILPRLHKEKFDSVDSGPVGKQFVVHLQLRRPVSKKTVEVMIVDSLPNGLRLIEDSPRLISGIESLKHSRVIEAKCAVNEPFSSVCFRVEITNDAKVGDLIEHQFSVIRKESTGEVLVDKARPIKIEVVEKNN